MNEKDELKIVNYLTILYLNMKLDSDRAKNKDNVLQSHDEEL